MSKRVSFKQHHVAGPPKGKSWRWHTVDIMTTEKWRKMPLMVHRLLEQIEIEHMAHDGKENGRLKIAYSQFEEWGISRRSIPAAIKYAIDAGFLKVKQGYHLKETPNEYCLTYLATRERTVTGAYEWSAPTNEWQRRAGKSFFIGQNVTLTVGQNVTLTGGAETPQMAETLKGEVGQNVTHTSISSVLYPTPQPNGQEEAQTVQDEESQTGLSEESERAIEIPKRAARQFADPFPGEAPPRTASDAPAPPARKIGDPPTKTERPA